MSTTVHNVAVFAFDYTPTADVGKLLPKQRIHRYDTLEEARACARKINANLAPGNRAYGDGLKAIVSIGTVPPATVTFPRSS